MKINLFKQIIENEVEHDERISEDRKDIQIFMLVLVKIAFCIALIMDYNTFKNEVPILFYTLLLEVMIEPLLRCLQGAFENSKEFVINIVVGCIITGSFTSEICDSIFTNQKVISAVLWIMTSIIMYFVYDWSYNLYLKKQDADCKN